MRLANPVNEDIFDNRLEELFKQSHLEETATLTLRERAGRAGILTNKVISVDQLR